MKVGAAPDIHKLQRPGSVDHSAEACLDSGFLQDTAERHEVQESALTAEIFKALYCVADSVRLLHQAQALDQTADLLDEKPLDFGDLRSNDRILFLETRVLNPVIEAAPLQRVMDLSSAIRGQHDVGTFLGTDRSELRYGDLKVG